MYSSNGRNPTKVSASIRRRNGDNSGSEEKLEWRFIHFSSKRPNLKKLTLKKGRRVDVCKFNEMVESVELLE